MANIDLNPIIGIARSFITSNLLPDTCTIYPMTKTGTSSGSWGNTRGTARTYNGNTAIPCRLDPTKQYRDQAIFDQEITVTDYFLNLPYDCAVGIDDEVVHGGITYQIKKLNDDQTLRGVKIAYVVSVR